MTESYAYGLWLAVPINAGIFIFFAVSFLKPKARWEWRSLGAFSAFIVALFAEMYGFPLTIYLLTSVLGSRYPAIDPFTHINGHLWVAMAGGSLLIWVLVMLISGAAMIGGLLAMRAGWKQIHTAQGDLVTSGLYGRVRHPQYSGLILITVGMLVQWPTIITAAMWPVLIVMYYRLARKEERTMEKRFGDQYVAYKHKVPMFLPRPASLSAGTKI